MVWDFASLVPESVHQFSFLFSDRGLPFSYRHMNGYSSHTYKWVNAAGEGFWVKLHYKTDTGIKCLTADEAKKNGDADHATRDLFNHIAGGKSASWTAYVQLMPLHEAAKYKYNIFDVTKVWPQKDYPLIKYGKLVLNRNPTNYFAEVEQSAFAPAHLVPGVEPSLDRMLQARLFSYTDTHRHRLGPNYLQIPINCPYATKVSNNQRDGFMTVNGNQGSTANFEPTSIAGTPKADASTAVKKFYVEDWVGQYNFSHPNSDFEQPGIFFRKVLNEEERTRLVDNIVGSLGSCRKDIQARMIDIFTKVDKDYGRRVGEGIMKKNAKL
jgi:catalase